MMVRRLPRVKRPSLNVSAPLRMIDHVARVVHFVQCWPDGVRRTDEVEPRAVDRADARACGRGRTDECAAGAVAAGAEEHVGADVGGIQVESGRVSGALAAARAPYGFGGSCVDNQDTLPSPLEVGAE